MTTVSLEMAKKLKEAGFGQDTEYKWLDYAGKGPHLNPFTKIGHTDNFEKLYEVICAAPTTDELLAELPETIHGAPVYQLAIEPINKIFWCGYQNHRSDGVEYKREAVANTLPEALAKMWLWLKSQNLLR